MPTLQQLGNTRIVMYYNDHPPPHVHIKLRDGRECTINITDLLVTGRIANHEIGDALSWIVENQNFLIEEWQRNNP